MSGARLVQRVCLLGLDGWRGVGAVSPHAAPIYGSDGSELLLCMRDVLPQFYDGVEDWTFSPT